VSWHHWPLIHLFFFFFLLQLNMRLSQTQTYCHGTEQESSCPRDHAAEKHREGPKRTTESAGSSSDDDSNIFVTNIASSHPSAWSNTIATHGSMKWFTAAVGMGIPMGIPMGMGMVWVWGLWWIPMGSVGRPNLWEFLNGCNFCGIETNSTNSEFVFS